MGKKKVARQDLRANVRSGHASLNPEVKDRGANLQPVTWRITALFLHGYIIYISKLTEEYTSPELSITVSTCRVESESGRFNPEYSHPG